ncbi:hypothetical protein PS1_023775 [Malus domestica]
MAKDLAVKKLVIHSDSQLITNQTTGEYMAKHLKMMQYLEKLIHYILVEYLDKLSIEAKLTAEVPQVSTTPNWQDSIINYLINDTLLMKRLESRKLQIKATRYYMWNDILVLKSYIGLHLCYLAPPDDLKVLSSIHEGICGNHSEGRSLT